MLDCLLVHVPRYVHFSDPPISIAYLYEFLNLHDIDSEVLDLSLDWYRKVEHDIDLYEEIDSWFMLHNYQSSIQYEKIGRIFGNVLGQPFGEGSTASVKFDDDLQLNLQNLSEKAQNFLSDMLQDWVIQIENLNPKVLGISLFSFNSLKITKLLILALNNSEWSGKIVLGGPGVLPERKALKDMCDLYIVGHGEYKLLDFCAKECNKNIQHIAQAEHYPNYSAFPLDKYGSPNAVRITGSRGCIKRCNFCDIYKQWPNFIVRDGRDIANEMIIQNSTLKSNPNKFYFTDSLINGRPKVLRDMSYHLLKQGAKFKWEGQFIATSPKWFTEEDYKIIAEAGCKRVSFGIESGSAKVRISMNKKQRDSDLDFCINQLHKNSIEQVWLIIVGFPTETWDDFLKTLNLFYRHKEKNRTMPIQCGLAEFRPDEGTDWHMANFDDLTWDDNGSWMFSKNKDLDAAERKQRLLFLEKKVIEWGYVHRAQNSPFGNENRPSESLNSLYSRLDPNYDLTEIEQRYYAAVPSSKLIHAPF